MTRWEASLLPGSAFPLPAEGLRANLWISEELFLLERPRILLVDDMPEILALCSEILQPHYEIVGTAADGESAIATFETTTPDAVVLDVSMPKLNGIEVARRLRSSGSHAAIIFLSGNVELMMAALEAGGSGFVLKRLICSDLHVAIREALAGRMFLSSHGEGAVVADDWHTIYRHRTLSEHTETFATQTTGCTRRSEIEATSADAGLDFGDAI